MTAPHPDNEAQRQATLNAYAILDTGPEQAFDDLAQIASAIFGVPMSAVTLVDHNRQWLKAKVGLEGTQTPRSDAFCAHTILTPNEVMVVPDTHLDPRFQNNPLVLGAPKLRFYAGAPLITPNGCALGALCVMDDQPNTLTAEGAATLQALARQVVNMLELRRVSADMDVMIREQAWYENRLRAENASLLSQAQCDPLTGLGNRRALRAAQAHLAHAGQNAWVSLLDIDRFKHINDTHGHPKGDEVLVHLSALLAQAASPADTVVRLGGEEFVWLMPNVSAPEAFARAELLRRHIEDNPGPIPFTVSQGLSSWTSTGTWEDTLLHADEALYAAKNGGRNTTRVWSDP